MSRRQAKAPESQKAISCLKTRATERQNHKMSTQNIRARPVSLKKLALFCLAITWAISPILSADTETLIVHVSPDGNDQGTGARETPFATIEQARNALRKAREVGPLTQGAKVVIHSGRYRLPAQVGFGEMDSGLPDAPVVIEAAPDAEVVFTSALKIPVTLWKPLEDEAIKAGLLASAQSAVVCADMNALSLPKPAQLRDNFAMPLAVPELFFDGRRMPMAGWPNDGWATIERIVDMGTMKHTGSASDAVDPNKERPKDNRGGVFTYEGDHPARWKPDRGLWLHGFWCFDWFDEVIRVQSIDTTKREITLAASHKYGLRMGNPSPRRWRAVHVLEEIDQPGEYFIDQQTNRLFFWPPGDLATARVTIGTRDEPLFALKNVNHLTLRGLTFEELQGDGLKIEDCHKVSIEGCLIRNGRRKGIAMSGGSGNRVFSCDIHDMGTGGIALGGGDRRTLTPAGHVVENTHIRKFSVYQLTYASALDLSGVGNVARHNLIHDAPHGAIGLFGNDHLVEYNIVRNVCVSSDDAAALYKGRNPSGRGNVVRHNLFRDIGSSRGHGTAAIYFDDGDGGERVYGNVFFRCGDPGKNSFGAVFSHGGHDNCAENNIFIQCKRGLGSGPWDDQRWKDYLNAPLWQGRLLKEVDITKPPYTTRYPELAGFMDPQPGIPRVNQALRNLFVECGEIKSGNWVADESNWATDLDPGFVDLAEGDFRLKPDAEVFRRIPGFQPVPVEKMGPYRVNCGIRKQ